MNKRATAKAVTPKVKPVYERVIEFRETHRDPEMPWFPFSDDVFRAYAIGRGAWREGGIMIDLEFRFTTVRKAP